MFMRTTVCEQTLSSSNASSCVLLVNAGWFEHPCTSVLARLHVYRQVVWYFTPKRRTVWTQNGMTDKQEPD